MCIKEFSANINIFAQRSVGATWHTITLVAVSVDFHDTILTKIAKTNIVCSVSCWTRNVDVVSLLECIILHKHFSTVKGTIEVELAVHDLKVAAKNQFIAQVHTTIYTVPLLHAFYRLEVPCQVAWIDLFRKIRVLAQTSCPWHLSALICLYNLRCYSWTTPWEVVAISNLYFVALLGLLCGNKHNTEGCFYTIDWWGSSIFQYRNALNVLRVDVLQAVTLHVINKDKRVGWAIYWTDDTTDFYRWVNTKLTSGCSNSKSWGRALQTTCDIGDWACFKLLCNIHSAHGTCKVDSFLGAITHNHHFVKHHLVLIKHNVTGAWTGDFHFLWSISHVTVSEFCGSLQWDAVVAIDVGNSALITSSDWCTWQRISVLVGDSASDNYFAARLWHGGNTCTTISLGRCNCLV